MTMQEDAAKYFDSPTRFSITVYGPDQMVFDSVMVSGITYRDAMDRAQAMYDRAVEAGPAVALVEWWDGPRQETRKWSRIAADDNGGICEPFIHSVTLNAYPDGGSWDMQVKLDQEYKVQFENTFPDSRYWEVATIDAPSPSRLSHEHLFSYPTQAQAETALQRVKEAQHRARIVLAVLELKKINADPQVIAACQSRMFQY